MTDPYCCGEVVENNELYLVPVKEYSGTESGELSGKVKDVGGGDHDGLQGPRHQLRHQHSLDDAQLLDLKRSQEKGTGMYISCGHIGNNTRVGQRETNTVSGSVKRMVEKYEMLGGGGTKQEMHPAPRKE